MKFGSGGGIVPRRLCTQPNNIRRGHKEQTRARTRFDRSLSTRREPPSSMLLSETPKLTSKRQMGQVL